MLVTTLNEYLDGATKVVFDHRGSIDKYIGDAVVATFGAFDDSGNHAREAVACALALDRFATEFAARQNSDSLIAAEGMAEKSREFREKGGEIYLPAVE